MYRISRRSYCKYCPLAHAREFPSCLSSSNIPIHQTRKFWMNEMCLAMGCVSSSDHSDISDFGVPSWSVLEFQGWGGRDWLDLGHVCSYTHIYRIPLLSIVGAKSGESGNDWGLRIKLRTRPPCMTTFWCKNLRGLRYLNSNLSFQVIMKVYFSR